MFNNLIESSSHAKEYKRRGSFLLFTDGTYVVLFVVAGVVSIYAYDARLEAQTLDTSSRCCRRRKSLLNDHLHQHQVPIARENANDNNAVTERTVAMLEH